MPKLVYSYLLVTLCLLTACGQPADPKQAFKNGDYKTAYELWLPLAKAGDPEAQNYLGIQYYLGLGVNRDFKKALEWYQKAAYAGFPDAQRNYGDMFYNGHAVPQDYYNAFIWYFAASQQGHVTAKLLLERLTDQNKLTPNQQMHAKLEANRYILDPEKRFQSHDTYIIDQE